MAARHVVVDGSNLATEGRSMPSLAQLDQAVREFLLENPEDMVTVVVDASFGHRIDPAESQMFEEAEAEGELVSPPAGAIGRGDAFLLRIADKTGATVLSNDSFQEFHGDYDWLFERGRLIGGKPVPGVGWIFTPRTPVRGPRSREAVKEAKRKTKGEPQSAMPGLDLAAERAKTTKGKGRGKVERAIAVALEEVVAPKDKPRRARKGGVPPAEPVNDPLTFITFIAAHPLGGEVTATVEAFASHGAFVQCEGALCYVPLSAMGEPPPKSAREVLAKGENATFVVQALDPQRRGVELAIPGFAKIAGAPTEETVAAEIEGQAELDEAAPVAAVVKRARKKRAGPVEVAEPADVLEPAAVPSGRRRGSAKKAAAPAEPALGAEPEPAAAVPSGRRRASAKKAAALAVVVEQAPEPVAAVPLGRRRASAKKAAAPAVLAAQALEAERAPAVVADPEPAAVAVPSGRRRGSAKKAAAPAAAAQALEAERAPAVVADPEPAAVAVPSGRRRGSAKKAAAPAVLAEAAAVAEPAPETERLPEPEPSGRRRAPAKKARPARAESPELASPPQKAPTRKRSPHEITPLQPAPTPEAHPARTRRRAGVRPVEAERAVQAPAIPEAPAASPSTSSRRRGANATTQAASSEPVLAHPREPDSGDGGRPRRNPTRVASEAAAAEKKATSVARRRPRSIKAGLPSLADPSAGAPTPTATTAALPPPGPLPRPSPAKAASRRRAQSPVSPEGPAPGPGVAPATEAPRRRRAGGRAAAGSEDDTAP